MENCQYKQISNIWMEKKAETIRVYNLSVEDYHTYYVSGHGVLVHNAECSRGNVNILENVGESGLGSKIKDIQMKSPEQLVKEGWNDITNPNMAKNTSSREFYDPVSNIKLRFVKGVEGANGYEAVDHYHIYNPNTTKKKIDLYFDIDGNPVGKGSNKSHIVIKGGK